MAKNCDLTLRNPTVCSIIEVKATDEEYLSQRNSKKNLSTVTVYDHRRKDNVFFLGALKLICRWFTRRWCQGYASLCGR